MKRIVICMLIFITGICLLSTTASATKIKVRGKGGIVLQPDGSQSICPQFSFKVCYVIEGDFIDIIKLIWDKLVNSAVSNSNSGGLSGTDINEYLPANVLLYIYLESGIITKQAQVVWVDNNCIPDSEVAEMVMPSGAVKINILN